MLDWERLARIAWAAPAIVLTTGCVTTSYVQTGATYAPRPSDCAIEVFSAGLPDRPFEEIGILEGEGSHWKADLKDIIPRLKEEACLAGGDALILLSTDRELVHDEDGLDHEDLYTVATVVRWQGG